MNECDNASVDAAGLRLGARHIPIPKTISYAAQKFLATPFPAFDQPPVTDKEGWRRLAAAFNQSYEPFADTLVATMPASVQAQMMGGATVYVGTPHDLRNPDWAHMTLHGGGWVFLGGKYVMGEAALNAAGFGCTTFAVDYRMSPDYPFPAGLEDCLAVYRELIKRYHPKKIIISGASAGGNLAAAVTLKIRDAGWPMPGVVGMLTAALDLTLAGDTLRTNRGVDAVLNNPERIVALYAGGNDLHDPYLSPLFADLKKGFPPAFLQSGTRDGLLSDAVRMHRKLLHAGIDAELHVWEAMPHGGFGGESPEDDDLRSQFLKFVKKHLVTKSAAA